MHKIRPKIIQVIYENRILFLVTTLYYKQFFFCFFLQNVGQFLPVLILFYFKKLHNFKVLVL